MFVFADKPILWWLVRHKVYMTAKGMMSQSNARINLD